MNGDFISILLTNDIGQVREFTAIQFHFHTESEHTINGVYSDFEMHIVCKETDASRLKYKDDPRTHAVFGLMFKQSSTPNPIFNTINFAKQGQNMNVNMYDLFYKTLTTNGNLQFYNYKGSLTAGSCAEMINWVLVDHIFNIGTTQLNDFKAMFINNPKFTTAQGNHRILQNLNNRVIHVNYYSFMYIIERLSDN